MIYNKNKNIWEDKTNQVVWYSKDYNSVRIKFYNSPKFYRKSYNDIEILQSPVNMKFRDEMYFRGHKLLEYKSVIKFDNWVKVFYNNKASQVFYISEITTHKQLINMKEDNILRFNYYKDLAQKLSIYDNEFLASMYDNLDIVRQDTVLSKFLLSSKIKTKSRTIDYIYPFGLNLSQKKAVENAFDYDISVIEGPPGTGKTQTILNIISNIVSQNKTVAVVSNNNAAIENIQTKLEEYNLHFLTALLGNKENKTQFFENTIYKSKPLEFLKIKMFKESDYELSQKVKYYQDILPKLYKIENKLALLKDKISGYKTELTYFNRDNSIIENKATSLLAKTLKTASLVLHIKAILEHHNHYSWLKNIFLRFKYRININKLYQEDIDNLIVFLDSHYYKLKLEELNTERHILENSLEKEGFDEAKLKYIDISKEVLNRSLYKKYAKLELLDYTYNNYRRNFDKFINEYPIVLSTSYALIPSADSGYVFDYLIIDEASQTDLLSSVLAMSCSKNLIVVGDTKQLSQIINQKMFEINNELKQTYKISPKYDYFIHNILTAVLDVFEDVPRVLLKEHYRCHPKIIGFCNQKFYNNELIILTENKENTNPLKVFVTVPGNHARKNPNGSGWYNQREIDEIKLIVTEISKNTIGIITPYNYQARLLRRNIDDFSNDIEIDTVHKFQGRAKDIIILSTVANDINKDKKNSFLKEDFVARSDLLNVAVSRAKKQLNVVVSDKIFNSKNNAISDLVKYIEYNSPIENIKKGKVQSVFDLLYIDYQKELQIFRSKNAKGYVSENLIFKVIHEILLEMKDNTLKVIMHYPLKMLIKNNSGLTKREKEYVSHNWSHVDFVILNILIKKPVLIIEVDGISFHEQNTKQSIRDNMKDKALKLNGLPLLRLKTNESNEKVRIYKALIFALRS